MANRFEPMEFPDAKETKASKPVPIQTQALTVEQREALTLPDCARAIVVQTEADYNFARAFQDEIARRKKFFDGEYDEGIDGAYQQHKLLVAQKKKWTDSLDAAKKIIGPKIADYLDEQDRLRLEAARAKARADEDAQRLADEAAAKAYELVKQGKVDKADALVEKAQAKVDTILATAPVVPEAMDTRGMARTEHLTIKIIDEGNVPREFCSADEKKIRLAGRLHKGQKFEIPGVLLIWVKDTHVRQP